MTIFGYKVTINQNCTLDEPSDEPYGDWSSSFNNSFGTISKSTDIGRTDVVSTINLEKSKGYLVWLEYSTGNSFGSAYCGSIESIGVVETLEAAEDLKKQLKDMKGNCCRQKVKTLDDQVIDVYPSWDGYFECLEEVHIEELKKGCV